MIALFPVKLNMIRFSGGLLLSDTGRDYFRWRFEILITLNRNKILFIAWCLALLLFFRLEIFLTPLGHDEAIYAYMSQQISRGAVLYRDVTDNKLPVLFWTAALVCRLPGLPQLNLLAFDTLVALCCVGLFYLIIRKYTNAVFWPVTAFIIFTNAHKISQGGFLTEHYLLFFVLLGWWFWLCRAHTQWTDLLSGISFGLAFLSKQVAVATLAGLGIYTLWRMREEPGLLRRYLTLLLGCCLMVGLVLLVLFGQGVLYNFWQDCFVDLWQYSAASSLRDTLENFILVVIDNAVSVGLIWFLIGLALCQKVTQNSLRGLFLICALLEFFSFAVGKTFYGHHFLQLAPVLGIIIALSVKAETYLRWKWFLASLLTAALLVQIHYTVRAFGQLADLRADYQTAQYIRQNTKAQDVLFASTENTRLAFLAELRHFYKRAYMAYPFSPEEQSFIQQEFDRLQPVYLIGGVPEYAKAEDYRLEKKIGRYEIYGRVN
jgi:4-amino-4-deoxy-L-arabinose transferase-like glycosyltransferase